MSQSVEVIAYHGWGFDQTCWAPWQARFAEQGISLRAFDRGYFGVTQSPSFQGCDRKVVMAHSYGLHLCPLEQLKQADVLVIFASFVTFHPAGDRDKRRSQRVLHHMIQACQQHPQTVLAQFHSRGGLPLSQALEARPISNLEQLVSDLQDLDTTHLDIQTLKMIPKVVIFHGAMDQIVPLNQGQELFEVLPHHPHFFPIKNAGHALPFTHLYECWELLREHEILYRDIPQNIPIQSGTEFSKMDGKPSSMNYKDRVAYSFGHATSTYNTHAVVQQHCAQELISILRSHSDQIPPGLLLEIGCGTGFVTQLLIDHWGDRPLIITDISADMLEACQQHLPLTSAQRQQIVFQQMDGEAVSADPATYAVIISNFVVQWFEQPIQSLQTLIATLKPGGILLTSFPTHKSFPEWQQICNQMDLPFTANPLPNPHDLSQALTGESVHCVWHEQEICTVYHRAIDFFKSLKLIGAGFNHNHQHLSPMQMKRLIQYWDQRHPEGIEIHYHVAFLQIQQKGRDAINRVYRDDEIAKGVSRHEGSRQFES